MTNVGMGADRLRAFVNAIPDILFVLDEEGRYVEALSSMQHLLYAGSQALIGRRMHDILPKVDADLFLATVLRTLESRESQRIEYTLAVPAGIRIFEGRTAPLDGLHEGKRLVVWVARDITEHRAAEEALRASEERLRQSSKMEAVGRLAGGVAHDFNNLLTVILGYSEMLEAQVAGEADAAASVEQIRSAAQQAARLTGQLLAFSRKQVLKAEILDLNAVIRGTEDMLRRLIGEHIELAVELAPGLRTVKADAGQMQQVIVNLAVNAKDAMPRGGRLAIRTRDAGPHVVVEVADTGSGMDAETRAHLFEPFYTTKGVGRGTGLGLSTVYGILKQSGGDVEVESARGRGTTFTLLLPAADGTAAPAAARVAEPAVGHGTVLVVEDSDAVRELVCRTLERAGYGVLAAPNADEAERIFRETAVDLVLTDVVMPRRSGPELAARMTAAKPAQAILFMSGYTEDAAFLRGVLARQLPFIAKPFAPAELLRKVREVLAGA